MPGNGQDYSDLCGISQEELEQYFEPEINALAEKQKVSVDMAKEMLAKMYDGYHFTVIMLLCCYVSYLS